MKQGYKNLKKRLFIAFIILLTGLAILSIYLIFFKPQPCTDLQCFFKSMSNCKRVYAIKEDPQSIWRYTIIGGKENSCDVNVQLITLKEGTIDIENLQGKEMVCSVLKGDTEFPEKDISKCTGKLKEELQDVLIQRMHNYLLQNVGEIDKGFKSIG